MLFNKYYFVFNLVSTIQILGSMSRSDGSLSRLLKLTSSRSPLEFHCGGGMGGGEGKRTKKKSRVFYARGSILRHTISGE